MVQLFKVGDPVQQGNVVTICYDFTGGAQSPVTAELYWDPEGWYETEEVELTADEPCQTRPVPEEATGGLLVDPTGQSEDRAITVTV